MATDDEFDMDDELDTYYSQELIQAIREADKKFPGKTFYAFNGYPELFTDFK